MKTITGVLMLFVACVFSDVNSPTNICVPRKIQFSSYTVDTGETSNVALDFDLNMGFFNSSKSAILQDFTTLKQYVTDLSGNCGSSDIATFQVYHQCLPADAWYVGSSKLGIDPNDVSIQTYGIPFPANESIVYSFIVGDNQPSIPITAIFYGHSAHTDFLFNHSVTISDKSVFNIPDPCPPLVIV